MENNLIGQFKEEKEKAESEIAKILSELNNKYGFESLNISFDKIDITEAGGRRQYIYMPKIRVEI